MLSTIKELYFLLTHQQRRRLLKLQFLVVLMAFAEIAGVLAIGPFMAIVGDIDRLSGEGLPAQLYQATGFEDPATFTFMVGLVVLLVLAGAACVSMYTTWRLSMYASQVGAELSVRLYKHYMHQPWLFHASGSSSQLTNKISQECLRVTNNIIAPLMQMNAKAVLAFTMAIFIFLLNPMVAVVGGVLFLAIYLLLYKAVRMKLSGHGSAVSETQQQRFKLMNEGFGGIKDTLLLGRQDDFNQRFEQSSRAFGQAHGATKALAFMPRYAMELVAFAAVIMLILYLLAASDGNLTETIPLLSVYALAGFKMLPALQQIYTSAAMLRGNVAALDSIKEDLEASKDADRRIEPDQQKLLPKESIALRDVVFRYPGKDEPALNGLSLTLPVNRVIGLVGASGSGKSTAIDVLLGLIRAEHGGLVVDGTPLAEEDTRAWQNSVGFVPQSIFLADASIRENIAFGVASEKIDNARVWQAAKMAHMADLIEELPDGINSRVGERGIQLSGGQRQRIGIARALYDDASVLVLDEATSALDGITEKLVMDAIHDFAGKKTIIMIAHRLSTVKECDCIYLLDAGRVADSGTYDELAARNVTFQCLLEHS